MISYNLLFRKYKIKDKQYKKYINYRYGGMIYCKRSTRLTEWGCRPTERRGGKGVQLPRGPVTSRGPEHAQNDLIKNSIPINDQLYTVDAVG